MGESHPQNATGGAKDSDRNVRRITLVLVTILAVLFVWSLVADRVTPFTSSARVQVFVVPVVPDVSGYIESIPIKKNQLAQAGDVLVKIEHKRFKLAVDAAKAALEVAGQSLGADTAGISTTTAKLVEAQTQLKSTKVQAERIFELEKKGIYAKAKGDEARTLVETKKAQAAAAQAELERAKQQLGETGANNPKIRLAQTKLAEAELNLARTTLIAPAKGFVGGLNISEGAYATAGQPLMTYLAIEDLWIEANMTENNLARIKPGDKAELAFDAYPGRVIKGKVKSTAVGVSTGKTLNLGELPTAKAGRSWLREPQRFPVIIELTDYKPSETTGGLRHNSQVDVIIYTGEGFFWNTLGKFWIRLVSLFSFIY
jgi:multidrug resistance efflux pump